MYSFFKAETDSSDPAETNEIDPSALSESTVLESSNDETILGTADEVSRGTLDVTSERKIITVNQTASSEEESTKVDVVDIEAEVSTRISWKSSVHAVIAASHLVGRSLNAVEKFDAFCGRNEESVE